MQECKHCNKEMPGAFRLKQFCDEQCRHKFRYVKRPKVSDKDRLFKDVYEDKSTGCLIWGGHTIQNGHGQISMSGKPISIQRAAWIVTYGPVPPGHSIRHKCKGQKLCINPKHLYCKPRNPDPEPNT